MVGRIKPFSVYSTQLVLHPHMADVAIAIHWGDELGRCLLVGVPEGTLLLQEGIIARDKKEWDT